MPTINVNGVSVDYPDVGDVDWGANATNFAVQTSAALGKIGLSSGTTVDIPGTLDVTGATTLDSTLTVAGTTTLNGIATLNGNTNLGNAITDTVTVTAILNVDSGVLYVDPSTNKVGINDTTPSEALDVTGNALISGTLGVTGNETIGGTLGVTGNLAVNTNKFNVTASSGDTLIAGTLGVTGALTAPIAASNISSGQLSSARMPIGTVIQVVSANDSGTVTISSTSFQSANLAATITPTNSNSKILVILNAGIFVFGNSSSSGRNHNLEIVKSLPSANTQIHLIDFSNVGVNAAGTNGFSYTACGLILDSPSTTSAITYTFRANISGECRLELHAGSSNSSIVLLEIAA